MAGSKRTSKRANSDDIPEGMVMSRVMPHSIELEKVVLGAISLWSAAFEVATEIINIDCFYNPIHQKIYAAMLELNKRSLIINTLSLMEELKSRGDLEDIGGSYYLTVIENKADPVALDQNCYLLLQYHMRRRCILAGGKLKDFGFDDTVDVWDLIDGAEKDIFDLTNTIQKKDYTDALTAVSNALQTIDAARANTSDFTGVPSGFKSMDRVTYGWQPTDLIILAARPSVGKTAFALNLAKNSALHPVKPVPVGFFSLEMSTSQLINRILSAESEIGFEKIQRGKLDDFEYAQLMAKGVRRIEIAPIYIDDTPAINIFEFRSKARRMVNKHKCGIIFLDYLQLMSGTGEKGENREQMISNISRNLKAIAKELNVPIIALSQLNRSVESRKESKMPQLSDLRESGAIEQDADTVMFIYRPEYYEIDTNDQGESTHGETHIRFAKHRNGKLETVKLRARLDIQKFEEVDNMLEGLGKQWKPVGHPNLPVRSFYEPLHGDDETPF